MPRSRRWCENDCAASSCRHRKGRPESSLRRYQHPVTKTTRHIFRMERKAETKANHDAEEDAVNMEAKGNTG